MNKNEIEETIKIYDQNAKSFAEKFWSMPGWARELKRFREFLPSGKILEVGSGAGRDARTLIETGYNYIGTDASLGMVEEARKRLPGVDFLQKDVMNLDFKEDSFDGFWASAILLHIPRRSVLQVLEQLHKVVRPDGVGFISVKEGDVEAFLLGDGRFFSFFGEGEFKRFLSKTGF